MNTHTSPLASATGEIFVRRTSPHSACSDAQNNSGSGKQALTQNLEARKQELLARFWEQEGEL